MNDENPILRSLELIETRITEKLTVENIASAVYFSKYHYQRLFQEIVGDSVMEYVTKRKLTLAGRALLKTNAAIIDVALEFGYDSREGFTRSFKSYMGVSPSEYRRYGLAAISLNTYKERFHMMYSKNTDEIIRELNEFIAKAKNLSENARKVNLLWYKEFWASVADDTDAFTGRLEAVLHRITSISEHPDEITNRFAILKIIEDISFETNVMALQIGLTAVGRAKPEDIPINKPIYDKYVELASMSAIKAGKVATFLGELTALIIDDMRTAVEQKVKDVIQKGRAAAENIQGYAIYIKDELKHMVDELVETPVESLTVSMLDECLFKMKIISLAAKVDQLRSPDTKPMFEGLRIFVDSLEAASDFFRTIIKPENNPPMERSTKKHFTDIAYQGNILRFYTKGEIEKMGALLESGGILSDDQKASFRQIDCKIDAYIKTALATSDESAYRTIGDMILDVASDLNREAENLGQHGGAIKMLAEQFDGLGKAVIRCIKE